MPDIGMATFVDFLSSTGASRVQKVKAAKLSDNEGYQVQKDFYKRLREGVRSYHSGNSSVDELSDLPLSLSDKKKQKNFPPAIEGLLKFEAKHESSVADSIKGQFNAHGLRVNVNPEVQYSKDGQKFATKLWFKTDQIPKSRVPLILATMYYGLPGAQSGVAILDTRRAKTHLTVSSDPIFEILLKAEAAAFMEIWNGLGA